MHDGRAAHLAQAAGGVHKALEAVAGTHGRRGDGECHTDGQQVTAVHEIAPNMQRADDYRLKRIQLRMAPPCELHHVEHHVDRVSGERLALAGGGALARHELAACSVCGAGGTLGGARALDEADGQDGRGKRCTARIVRCCHHRRQALADVLAQHRLQARAAAAPASKGDPVHVRSRTRFDICSVITVRAQ